MRITWLLAALVLSATLAALQWWAVTEFLYWRYTWFDIPMHYLGGATLAAFVAALLVRHRPGAYALALIVLFVGWEVFEFVFGIQRKANYPLDTFVDLVLDTLGALTTYALARLTIQRSAQ